MKSDKKQANRNVIRFYDQSKAKIARDSLAYQLKARKSCGGSKNG